MKGVRTISGREFIKMADQQHWTERSTGDFLYAIAADFVTQIELTMEKEHVNQTELAGILGVTEGRVSQVLNNPGNLTLLKVVEYARALGRKVSIVCYDDGASTNKGVVHAKVFSACWERAGKPKDFFALQELNTAAANIGTMIKDTSGHIRVTNTSSVGAPPRFSNYICGVSAGTSIARVGD